ncbi:hypothetical protein SUGI_0845000 [Cryptomeria japonica]|nr:hypothetical protein SUGI_0845000 [Cryptomeria japonica]
MIYPMVDVLDSKEVCIHKIDGFVRAVDGQAIASAILDMDLGGWMSILGYYFNPAQHILEPQEERSDSEDEEAIEDFVNRPICNA